MIDRSAILAPLAELRDLARRGVEALERMEAQPLRGLGPEDLLTEEEVARYVRIQRAKVRGWIAQMKIPRALSPGRRGMALYRVVDVRRALEHGAAVADDAAWDGLGRRNTA